MPNTVRRSLFLSFAQRYTSILISVPTIMLLARYLTPAETGIFGVVLAFTYIAQMLRDFGVGDYLIQERNLNRDVFRTTFTIMAGISWLLAGLIFAAGPFAANFYDEAGVAKVMHVVAFNFFFIPFGAPAASMMRRELNYGQLYIQSVFRTFVRSTVSVALAIIGFGYMSLAWGALAGAIAGTTAIAIMRPRDVFLLPCLRGWRSVVSFGYKITFVDIVRQLANHGKDLVIAQTLGFASAGLYSRGAGLINLFNRNFQAAIRSVIYPAFAERHRNDEDPNALFVKNISYVGAIAWPFYIFVALMAYPIILAALGPQWVASVPILRILAISAGISTAGLYTGQILMATGHVNSKVLIDVIVHPIRLVLIVVAAFHSIEAVAATQVIMAIITITLQYQQLRKHLQLHFLTVMAASRNSMAIAAGSSIAPLVVFILNISDWLNNPWIALFAAAVGAGTSWLICLYALKHPLTREIAFTWENISNRFRLGYASSK